MIKDEKPDDQEEKLHSEFFPLFKKWNGYKDSLNTEGIREAVQDILRNRLIGAGLVTEDHFYNLIELVHGRIAKGKRTHLDREIVEGLVGSEEEKSGAYLREAVRELDPSLMPGMLPYVDEHGLDVADEDRYVYTILEAWDRIGDAIQGTLDYEEGHVITKLNKSIIDLFEFVFTDELLARLGTTAEEIKRDMMTAWEAIEGA